MRDETGEPARTSPADSPLTSCDNPYPKLTGGGVGAIVGVGEGDGEMNGDGDANGVGDGVGEMNGLGVSVAMGTGDVESLLLDPQPASSVAPMVTIKHAAMLRAACVGNNGKRMCLIIKPLCPHGQGRGSVEWFAILLTDRSAPDAASVSTCRVANVWNLVGIFYA